MPGAFNLNGIEATGNGRTLIVVNSTLGTLYTIDAATGVSEQIDLGGATVPTGDGVLLVGGTLLVLQNGAQTGENQISVVQLRHHRTKGEIVDIDHQSAVRDRHHAGAERLDVRRRECTIRPAARRPRAGGGVVQAPLISPRT